MNDMGLGSCLLLIIISCWDSLSCSSSSFIYLFIFQEIDLLSQFQHENIVQYHGTAKVLFSVFHTIFCLSVAFGVCFLIYIIDIFCYWVYRIMLYQGFLSFVKFPIIYYIYFISGADLCFLLQLMSFMHCF